MEKFKVRKTELVEWKAIGWLFQGLARSLFMVILIQHLLPKINSVYGAGFSKISFFSLLVLGPALFFISYVEKSRVSYWVAGILRLRGYEIEPDFRSPWMATDLLDYWRRFHYWIWEFYSDSFFGPLSVLFSRWWGAYMALSLSIFLTFVIGTTISHLIYYPGGVGLTIVLSFLFGLATLFHLLIVVKWQNIYLKRTFTWITVWCLYICAYPIFGLGWDLNQLMEFWNK